MSVEAKLSYRKNFLKSEEWKDIRFRKMVRDGSACDICGKDDFSNDAHHVFYPQKWSDTSSGDLVMLCRLCHDAVHVFPKKGADCQSEAWVNYLNIRNKVLKHIKKLEKPKSPERLEFEKKRNDFVLIKRRFFELSVKLRVLHSNLPFPRYLRRVLEGQPVESLSLEHSVDKSAV